MAFKEDKPSRFKPDAIDSGEPKLSEKIGAGLYGAATGFVGGPGELEKFGAYTVPEFFGYETKPEEKVGPMGRETIFPTISEVEKGLSKIGINKPREEVSGYQTAGEILGGLAPSMPGLAKSAGKALIGTTTKEGERIAREAEKLGFKLSPSQVRADVPVAEKGATGFDVANQELANKLVSKGTGKETELVTADFIGGRLKDLGKEFDKVYKGKTFNIDQNAVDAIRQISAKEANLPGVAVTSPVKQTADKIINSFDTLSRQPGAKPGTFAVEGEALQTMRNALAESARGGSRTDAHEIYNLLDEIDASVAKNHPDVAKKLNEIRPQYRNSIVLEDLYRANGIKQGNVSLDKLGKIMTGKRDVVRRNPSDIDNLAEIGKELNLKARWESSGKAATAGQDLLGKALGTGADVASSLTGLKSRLARAAQRRLLTTEPQAGYTRLPLASSLGVIPGQIQKED